MNEVEYLTLDQVAERLQVSMVTVYKYINRQDNPLPVVYLSEKTPRVIKSELDKWVESNKKEETK